MKKRTGRRPGEPVPPMKDAAQRTPQEEAMHRFVLSTLSPQPMYNSAFARALINQETGNPQIFAAIVLTHINERQAEIHPESPFLIDPEHIWVHYGIDYKGLVAALAILTQKDFITVQCEDPSTILQKVPFDVYVNLNYERVWEVLANDNLSRENAAMGLEEFRTGSHFADQE